MAPSPATCPLAVRPSSSRLPQTLQTPLPLLVPTWAPISSFEGEESQDSLWHPLSSLREKVVMIKEEEFIYIMPPPLLGLVHAKTSTT